LSKNQLMSNTDRIAVLALELQALLLESTLIFFFVRRSLAVGKGGRAIDMYAG